MNPNIALKNTRFVKNIKIKPLKCLGPDLLNTKHLKLVKDLENLGLKTFVSMNGPTYPRLVKMFYTSLTISNERNLTPFVKNTKIQMNACEFVELFEMKIERLWVSHNKFSKSLPSLF